MLRSMDEALRTYGSRLHHSFVKVFGLFRWDRAQIVGCCRLCWILLHLVQRGSFVNLSWHLSPDISFLALWWWQSKGLDCLHWWLVWASLFIGVLLAAFIRFVLRFYRIVVAMIYTILVWALNLNVGTDNSWSNGTVCILWPIGRILTTIAIVLASVDHVIANLHSVVSPILRGKLDEVVDILNTCGTVIQTALRARGITHA